MIKTFFILSAMFLALFLMDIPLVIIAVKHGKERHISIVNIKSGVDAALCVVCLIATIGILVG